MSHGRGFGQREVAVDDALKAAMECARKNPAAGRALVEALRAGIEAGRRRRKQGMDGHGPGGE